MTRAKDISKIVTDANLSGTLDVTGTVTAGGLDIQGDGTISGGSRLTISDIADENNDGIRLDDSTTARFNNLTQDSSGNFKIQHWTGSAWQNNFTLTTGGNVGIGTSSPNEKLTINSGALSFLGDISTPSIGAGLFRPANNTLAVVTGSTERMRINSSGNVGIGNTFPQSFNSQANQLVVGTGSGDNGITIYSGSGSGDTSNLFFADGFNASEETRAGIIYNHGTDTMNFRTSDTANRLVIDGSGKVIIGGTDAGLHKAAVFGATGGNATFKAANTSTSGNTTCIIAFMDGSGSASSNSAFLQGFNGVTSYYLLGNGTHTFTSDVNVKKNIETTRDGYLEDLARLRVVKYNWKHEEDGANKELGLIAQEVEEVFPNLVMEDFDPQIEDGQRRNKMIKTTVLPFMLLKALQEANTKIEALETTNTALEARIVALETA